MVGAQRQQTEVGHIPSDWSVRTVGELAEVGGGTTPSRTQAERYFADGMHPWVKTLDLNNAIIRETDERVTDVALQETSLRLYPKGTVLVAMYGGFAQIGRTGMLAMPAAINQALTAICPTRIYSRYLLAFLNFRVGYWRTVAASSRKDPNITRDDVLAFPVACPPSTGEQQAIAEVLSDADVLIESIEQLIAKKRLIKQGAMQELLTGKRRLPGFGSSATRTTTIGAIPQDWMLVPIGELLDFKNGLNKAKAYFGTGTPIVNYMDVFGCAGLTSDDVQGLVTVTADEQRNYSARRGDVFFTRTSETVDEIGIAAVLLEAIEGAVFSGFVLRGRPKTEALTLEYKKYCFGHEVVRRQIVSTASYTTRALTNGRLLSKVLLPLPPTDAEQLAISNILSEMDAELDALAEKLEKARLIKQGMMHNLLTGKIRLV